MSETWTGVPKICLSSAKVKTWQGEIDEMVPAVWVASPLGELRLGGSEVGGADDRDADEGADDLDADDLDADEEGADDEGGSELDGCDVGDAEVSGPPVGRLDVDGLALVGASLGLGSVGPALELGLDVASELPANEADPLTVLAHPTASRAEVSTPATTVARRIPVISPS